MDSSCPWKFVNTAKSLLKQEDLVRFLLAIGKDWVNVGKFPSRFSPLYLRTPAQLEEMTVSRKSLRMLMCAAVAASLGMFGTATNATFYGGDFDPPDISGHFTGNFLLNVGDGCNSDGCTIDLISLFITGADFFGSGWFSTGQSNIVASSAGFGGGLHFNSVVISLSQLFSDFSSIAMGSGTSAPPGCTTPSLKFTSFFDHDFLGHPGFIADLGCFDGTQFISGDTAVYVAAPIPEPGTLVLLVGGIGAAWLTRRRRMAA